MAKSSTEIIAENIKRLRLLKKLTQEELAFRCGFHPSYIGLIERKQQTPSLKSLNKLAKALNTTCVQLLSDTTAKPDKKEEKQVFASEITELFKPLNKVQTEILLTVNKLLIKLLITEKSNLL